MIKHLILTQLVENTAGAPGLLAEHGVSFHIEADGHHLLFDTGQGLALKHNAEQMGIPMELVECIILSHGHYDHSGGLVDALQMTGRVDLLRPNHCTGLDAVCYFKNRFPDAFHESATGARHIFGSA